MNRIVQIFSRTCSINSTLKYFFKDHHKHLRLEFTITSLMYDISVVSYTFTVAVYVGI